MNRVAMDVRVPATRIADVVNEKRAITADTALRFARYFNNSPTFWMNLQTRYDLEVAEDEIADKVERDVRPLSAAAVKVVQNEARLRPENTDVGDARHRDASRGQVHNKW
jgi:addiction module HigA family antidote